MHSKHRARTYEGMYHREKACKGTTFFRIDQIIRKENVFFLKKRAFFSKNFHFAKCGLQNKDFFAVIYPSVGCGRAGAVPAALPGSAERLSDIGD